MSDPFNDYSQNTQTTDNQSTTLSCSVPVLSLLATVFGWVGGIIIFFLEKQNVYVRAVALQSFIINGIVFMVALFCLCFYWAGLFFVICFWIMFVITIAVIIVLAVIAFIKSKSGDFIGIPFLDRWILSIANQ
ncbi:hypothetical protein CL6EHI_054480 [Entamoeba histolytica]|uniref:DUF4870 domain-containing protein n=3 Tax=Entamoeba histolytica TaxID=5759 RepID=C4M2H9_ENTH1|nr:hypothetical protein EHI_054480 [Entamoeba histolytica HM-1:IMSS]EAL46698.1 hypothetical protein EHI_054480 [Entamoeba histolytica HM-1:IMSS]EMD46373.1 Hypothetical protein EHI5A_092970 [Entamoeba histolytica KU27]GAT95482.1 hypothetical protein CL6EHI_054480 [Entamoeba histolytica]|eukprot:XP_652084.1 hypothetical protein EHI_054480 [Entamoeba histolytica HM-1:IMSS]